MAQHKPHRQTILTLFLTTWFFLTSFNDTSATITLHEVAVLYTFGEQISFQAIVKSEAPIADAMLFVAVPGQSTRVIPVTADTYGMIRHTLDVVSDPVRPFAEVRYWYTIRDKRGGESVSREYSFLYLDNRLPWSVQSDGSFEIFWNAPHTRLEGDILAIARSSFQSAVDHFPAVLSKPIQIYIYTNEDDLRTSLSPGQNAWSAGHANPQDATIVMLLPQGSNQRIEAERLLPHEMSHILLFAYSQENYATLPVWLVEGIASSAELNPDPERTEVVRSAADTDTLISMRELCTRFPEDDAAAYLAYAQSESFVQFLIRKYGVESLLEIATQSNNGLSCEEAFQATYHRSLSGMETEWKLLVLGVSSANVDRGAWAIMAVLLGLLILAPLVPTLVVRFQSKE